MAIEGLDRCVKLLKIILILRRAKYFWIDYERLLNHKISETPEAYTVKNVYKISMGTRNVFGVGKL